MIRQPDPRPERQNPEDHNRQVVYTVAKIIPWPHLVPEYIVLTALFHHPDLAAPHISRLHPCNWEDELLQDMAHFALSQLSIYRRVGNVGINKLTELVLDAGMVRLERLEIELKILERVAELPLNEAIVADAVADLTSRRIEGAA